MRKLLFIFALPILAGLIFLYWKLNPQEWSFFPKCPLYHYTGLKCSGCGSQRAIHDLLHLDFVGAFRENALIPFAIPYMALGFYLNQKKSPNTKQILFRRRLFGLLAIRIILALVIGYAVLRNMNILNWISK